LELGRFDVGFGCVLWNSERRWSSLVAKTLSLKVNIVITMKLKFLLIPLFFFLFLSISNVYAYENYNSNPLISATNLTSGFWVFDAGVDTDACVWYNPLTWIYCFTGYNATTPCFNVSVGNGFMNFDNIGCNGDIAFNHLLVFPTKNYDYIYASDLINLNITNLDVLNDALILPANKQIIIAFSYKVNSNFTASADASNTFYGYELDGLGQHTTPLNLTANIWYNYTMFIDAVPFTRIGYIFAQFKNAYIDIDANISISKFKVYTIDINEPRDSWNSNLTLEKINYCGAGSYLDRNYTSVNTSILLARTAELVPCVVMKLGNITIARTSNCTYGSSTPTVCNALSADLALVEEIILRDGYYFYSGNVNNYQVYFEKLSLLSAKITTIQAGGGGSMKIAYDGDGAFFQFSNLTGAYPKAIRQEIDTTALLNDSTPSASNWRYTAGSVHSFHPFFSFNGITCVDIAGLYCDYTTNYQYYRNPDCTINPTSYAYCGEWGCNANLTGCDYGFIGTYCLNNYSYVSVDINGTTIYNSCYPDYCFNLTNSDIGCYASEEEFIASTATATDSMALTIGGLFSLIDLPTSKALSSLLFSVIGGVGVALLLSKKSKYGDFAVKAFEITAFSLIFMFTLAGWFYVWAFGIMLLFVAFILFGLDRLSGNKTGG
jgi:hypothetical protein